MGDCRICGQPAGLFRSVHKKCEADRSDAMAKFIEVLPGYAALPDEKANLDGLRAFVEKLSAKANFDEQEFKDFARREIQGTINSIMADNDISDCELNRLNEIFLACDLSPSDLNEDSTDILVNGLILRDLKNGIVRSRIPFASELPINLKSGEEVLWFTAPATRMETKTKTKYIGGSHGFSFRIMRGVSYRVGAFRGEPIQTTSLVPMGVGGMAVTNFAVYFLGSGASYRMSISTIATVEAYADGICLTPNRGKSQIFLIKNPTFASELVKAIGALS